MILPALREVSLWQNVFWRRCHREQGSAPGRCSISGGFSSLSILFSPSTLSRKISGDRWNAGNENPLSYFFRACS